MSSFFKRNMMIYFKDKGAVFYSLIGTLMIFLLYVLFLGNLWTGMYDSNIENANELINSWVMAGILAVVSATSSSGILGIMVNDKSTNVFKDFVASPVKKSHITGGYVLAVTVAGLIMSFITLIISEVYIVICGGHLLSLSRVIEVLVLLVIVSLSNTSFMIFFASFFKSHNAFTSAAGILNSCIGFIAGAYIPIGMFPAAFRYVLEMLPIFQGSALLRQAMMGDILDKSCQALSAADKAELYHKLGITIQIGNYEFSNLVSFIIIGIAFTIFFSLGTYNIAKKRV